MKKWKPKLFLSDFSDVLVDIEEGCKDIRWELENKRNIQGAIESLSNVEVLVWELLDKLEAE